MADVKPDVPNGNDKLILFHGFNEEEARFLLRLVKENLENSKDIAFCMSTETNLEWKLRDLVKDVTEEHAYMVALEEKNKKEREAQSDT